MSEQRDKFLTEAMGIRYGFATKLRAAIAHEVYEINFSTWAGFGKLWEWSQKQGWWKSFSNKMYCGYYSRSPNYPDQLAYDVINPDRFADAVYAFLKDRKGRYSYESRSE